VGALAALLAALATTGVVRIGYVLGITFLTGTLMAFDMPTWQSIIPDLVGMAVGTHQSRPRTHAPRRTPRRHHR